MKINWTLEKKSQFPLPDKIREELMEKIVHARGQMKLLIALFVLCIGLLAGFPKGMVAGMKAKAKSKVK